MNHIGEILESVPIPELYRISYHLESEALENPGSELRRRFDEVRELLPSIDDGDKEIAVAVGSRGIHGQPDIVRALIDELKAAGMKPFIIPAMGSHAGADAAGQKAMLEGLGISEQEMGAEIHSSMEVVQIGTTGSGLPVFVDAHAFRADGIVLVNRIKAHTSFKGIIESGLLKMSVIGLGKQKGAEICHDLGFEHMTENVLEIARLVLEKAPILFGLGIIEDARHEPAEIHLIPAGEIESREPALLKRANELLARLPFASVDALIIDAIGKDISGTGLDTNVVGRYHTGIGSGGPSVTRISVLDLTEATHGNGNGLGIADFTTRRVFEKFDLAETYPNALTSNSPVSVKIPMILPDDRSAIRAAIKTSLIRDKAAVRLVRIGNTASIEEMEVSGSLIDEVKNHEALEILEGPYPLLFDAEGNLPLS